jgi:hypothetical protein
VAVLQPAGQFAVLRLADGHTLAEDQLLPEVDAYGASQLMSLFVLSSPDRYFVMANRRKSPDRTTDDKFFWIGSHAPIVQGRLYAINRATGKAEWPVPAEIEYHGLVLNQPQRLPVLVFARHAGSNREQGRDLHLMCVDKRTGCVVSRVELSKTVAYDLTCSAEPAERTVQLSVPSRTVKLAFAAGPIPPEPPAQSGDREFGVGGGLLKALGSFFGFGESSEEGEDLFREDEE